MNACLTLLVSCLTLYFYVLILPSVQGSDVQLFQTLKLTILRAETNKHRTGVKRHGHDSVPNLYVQVNIVAVRWDGHDIGREKFYYRTKTKHSGKPVFNETLSYVKGVSPGFVIGTDTVFRVNLYDKAVAPGADQEQEKPDDWLGQFEIRLGHEVANDRSKCEMMNVMLKPGTEIGSVVWYEYDFVMFESTGGLWGSDVQENWSGNVEPDSDYGR